MGSVNRVILIGNLGADPEVRYTQGGTAVGNFRIATTNKFKRNDEWQEETEWHRITVWGKMAENCAQYLSKGRQVYVEGRMQTRKWEDRDGNTRYTTEVVANSVVFLGSKEGGSGGGRSGGGGNRNRSRPEEPPPDESYGPGGGHEDESDVPF